MMLSMVSIIRITITILIIAICKSNVAAHNLPFYFLANQDWPIGGESSAYDDELSAESSFLNWNNNGNKKSSTTYAAMVLI